MRARIWFYNRMLQSILECFSTATNIYKTIEQKCIFDYCAAIDIFKTIEQKI